MVKSKKLSRGSLAVLLMALVLACSMVVGLTGAWFTAQEGNEGVATFGSISLSLSGADDSSDVHFTTARADGYSDSDSDLNYVMPGDTVSIQVILTNAGNNDLYYMIYLSVEDGVGTYGESLTGWYTWDATNEEWDLADYTLTANQVASKMEVNDEYDGTLTFTISGADTGNTYQNGELSLRIDAYAIQCANRTAAEAYTYITTNQSSYPENAA